LRSYKEKSEKLFQGKRKVNKIQIHTNNCPHTADRWKNINNDKENK